jgi:hypothetical protein
MSKSSKGGQWERDIAKILTFWLTGQNKEYYFWRSPGSGSIATNTGTNPSLHGDIIPVKPEAEFFCNIFLCECKNGYKEASLNKHLKYNKSDPIKSFWEQCVEDAQNSNKYPMLIFKKKGYPTPWLGITYEIYNKINKYLKELRYIHLCWAEELPDIYFFEYKEFFDIISPDIIKEHINVIQTKTK